MTLPPAPGTATTNGQVAAPDPVHGGPLPQATLLELFGRLINDASELADRQIDLAKQEIGEAKDDAIHAVFRLAIGAGIAVAAAVLLVITAWTAFIWLFNWIGAHIVFPTPFGPQSLAWLGWLVGFIVPVLAAYLAWRMFIRGGIDEARALFPPLPRTRETLKEDLEWVRTLPTRIAR